MIFLDSSFIIAYLNEADVNHAKAFRIAEDVDNGRYGSSVITDYVFDEVITVLLFKTRRLKQAVESGEGLLLASRLLMVDRDAFDSAWGIFKDQRKALFSFTDCVTIAVCRANGISNLATFDGDFKEVEDLNVIGI